MGSGRGNIQELAGKPSDGLVVNCCVHYWCGPCAVCQETRFVNKVYQMNGGQIPRDSPRGRHRNMGGTVCESSHVATSRLWQMLVLVAGGGGSTEKEIRLARYACRREAGFE